MTSSAAEAFVFGTYPHDTVRLPGRVLMESIDPPAELPEDTRDAPSKYLQIDMSEVTFMVPEALVVLLSELRTRQLAGHTTELRLPKAVDVREFLRVWDFPSLVRRVTGIPFIDFVHRDDHKYFRGIGGDQASEFRYRASAYVTESQLIALETRRFFSFRHWDTRHFYVETDPARFLRAINEESARWAGPVISSFLLMHLGEYYRYLPGSVIHEAMSNAFRHGGATSVIAGSKASYSAKSKGDTFLTLVFWDDGVPSYNTLGPRVRSGEPITSPAFDLATDTTYEATVDILGRTRFQQIFKSKNPPSSSAAEYEFFLATVYPGVTSDPLGRGHTQYEAGGTPRASQTTGMGLTNILNGAVDILGGSVALRSGSYFMNFKATAQKKAGTYATKIEARKHFRGNMVTVRVPLRKETTRPAERH